MHDRSKDQRRIIDIYRKPAKGYDASGISGLEPWRRVAVRILNLERGVRVSDLLG